MVGGGGIGGENPLEFDEHVHQEKSGFSKAGAVDTLLPPPLRISGGVRARKRWFVSTLFGGKKERNLPAFFKGKVNVWAVHPKTGLQIWPSKPNLGN